MTSYGKFLDRQIKNRLVFEKSAKTDFNADDFSSSDEQEDIQLKLKDKEYERAGPLFEKSYFSDKEVVFPEDRIEEFGNLTMGVKPANLYQTSTQYQNQEITEIMINNPDEVKLIQKDQKGIDRLIKEQNSKDTVKESS